MITLYHNPRCSKSRTALQFLEQKGVEVEIRYYLKNPLTLKEITFLLELLTNEKSEIIRKNETIWKEKFSDTPWNDELIVEALLEYPKLLQRPILVKDSKAVIARSQEVLEDFFS